MYSASPNVPVDFKQIIFHSVLQRNCVRISRRLSATDRKDFTISFWSFQSTSYKTFFPTPTNCYRLFLSHLAH